jgi:hypothetical protein
MVAAAHHCKLLFCGLNLNFSLATRINDRMIARTILRLRSFLHRPDERLAGGSIITLISEHDGWMTIAVIGRGSTSNPGASRVPSSAFGSTESRRTTSEQRGRHEWHHYCATFKPARR